MAIQDAQRTEETTLCIVVTKSRQESRDEIRRDRRRVRVGRTMVEKVGEGKKWRKNGDCFLGIFLRRM
jgi:hypothetical protein